MQKHVCAHCGWIYNPDEGFPVFGIKPGTPFEKLLDDFACPVCGARKKDFLPGETRQQKASD